MQLREGLAAPALADADAGLRGVEPDGVVGGGDDIRQLFLVRPRQSRLDRCALAEALAGAVDVFVLVQEDGDGQGFVGGAQSPEIAGASVDLVAQTAQ